MSSTISKRPRPKIYTEEDVALHKSAGSCWVIVENKVYDVTSYVARILALVSVALTLP